VKWLRFSKGGNVPVASLDQVEELLTHRPGQVAGVKYGV
jgi:hypothetical protein